MDQDEDIIHLPHAILSHEIYPGKILVESRFSLSYTGDSNAAIARVYNNGMRGFKFFTADLFGIPLKRKRF